jgi:hypothetical protein
MIINKQLRTVLLIFGVLVALLIGWQAYESYKHRGQIAVNIVVLPSDSKLTVDNAPTKPGKVYLIKGSHKLVASRSDFGNDIKTISTYDVKKGDSIYMLPVANSDAAKKWLMQHPDVQRDREAAGGAEAERIRRIIVSKYPILNNLPYENLHFKIDYSLDDNNKLSFVITLYAIINRPSEHAQYVQQLQQYKAESLQYLKDSKIDPTKFTIKYIPNV